MEKSTLEFKWTVSRGRDTYGYNICSLYVNGVKIAAVNGGGYDMKGTALGNWVARAYAKELTALTPDKMPVQSHWERNPERNITIFTCRECGEEWKEEEFSFSSCPLCGKKNADSVKVFGTLGMNDGKRVDDGRYFYGLTFHDPDYDPGKAVIGKDAVDRTLGKGAEGKTVEQAEKDGESLGLERYQAFYSASSKTPDEKHRVPLIDGACGFNEVEKILAAIGLILERVPGRSKKVDVYRLRNGKDGG